ncbi:MAG: hypothetical protein M3Q60_22700 [Actinomycetota bacterium]|nr:hypothetical protein [Actinomycetota bacterium]
MPEAAAALGISPEAVRNRLSRGTLKSVKEDGRVFVLIDRDMVRHTERPIGDTPNGVPPGTSELVEEMRARIEDLRDQLSEERAARRRADTIIMQLTQTNASLAARLPELEQGVQDGLQEPPHEAGGVEDGGREDGLEKRSWWRRLLG